MGILNTLPKPNNNFSGWPWDEESDCDLQKSDYKYPKISIVTPSFNQGQYIEETIRSVLLQNYPNVEYIIIDGGSTDNTIEIIKKYEPWISYWISEKDSGQSDAINKGIQHCTGEIFNWLNSDDYYLKNIFYKLNDYFSKDSSTDIIAGKTFIFGINDRISDSSPVFNELKKTISASRINQPATFLKLKIIKELYPLHVKLHYVMDLHLWLKYLIIHGTKNICSVDDILVNFREHSSSKTILYEANFYIEKYMLLHTLQQKIINNLATDEYLFFETSIPPSLENEILLGINDCFLYWLKFFSKNKNTPLIQKLINYINPSKLSARGKMEYFKIKFLNYNFKKII